MPLWKRLIIISGSAGAGFALMLALIAGGAFWYSSRPKPWNTRAIKATFDFVDTGDDGQLVFYYILQNMTDLDYRLEESPGTTIMVKLQEQNSLGGPLGSELKLDFPVFIPSRQRRSYSISLPSYRYPKGSLKDDPSKEERHAYRKELAAYVTVKLSNLDGFVLFDEASRYQINFPRGW